MRKVLLLLFATIMMFTGCSSENTKNTNNIVVNSDLPNYQYMFNLNKTCPIQKTHGGYYVMSSDFLYYVDEKSLDAVPLCNKSNCMHTQEDKDCNAYFETTDSCYDIQVYKNYVYILKNEISEDMDGIFNNVSVLYKVSLDGSTRDKCYTFDNYVNQFFIIDDNIYYDIINKDSDSYESNVNNNIYKKSLNGSDSPKLLVDYSDFKGHYKYGCSIKNIYKGKLYVYETYQTIKNTTNTKKPYIFKMNFSIIDLNTGKKINEFPMDTDGTSNYFAGICGSKNQLFRSVLNEKKNIETYYLSDLDGNNPKEVFTQNLNKNGTVKYETICDDKYIYVDNVNENSSKNRCIEVYDTSGKKISKVYYPNDSEGLHIVVQGDEKYLWLNGNGNAYAVDKSQLLKNNSKFTVKQIT